MTARDPIDALAEVLRNYETGGPRQPHWRDLLDVDKLEWRQRAIYIRDELWRRGLVIDPAPNYNRGTEP